MDTRDFYDDLADLYDIIYVDWEAAGFSAERDEKADFYQPILVGRPTP
ncbi:MAG TPA: hypothetical protein VJ925_08725 [Longimicrobiales bacterium]|nr:hypothetical protein [Longimicrobiales bacterium]